MAYEPIQSFRCPGTQCQPFVPQNHFDRGLYSGVLELAWVIPKGHPVVIGAGVFELQEEPVRNAGLPPGSQRVVSRQQRAHLEARTMPAPRAARLPANPEIVADVVRSGPDRLAVLPGSSLKGAVRQVYELLTPSCQLACCKVKPSQVKPDVCPACSLFGVGGLGGRLAFGEAEPEAAYPLKSKVPTAWPPRDEVPDTYRIYDLARAKNNQGEFEEANELTWSVHGRFTSRLRVINASPDELGLLFAALGLGRDPSLRLGGKKFHGLGAVKVEITRLSWRYPQREDIGAQVAMRWALEQQAWALQDPERNRVWTDLHKVISSGGGAR